MMELGTLSSYNAPNAKLIQLFLKYCDWKCCWIYSPSGFIPRLFYYPMLSFRKHRILTTSPTYVYLLSSHLLSHLPATCVSQESNNCANLLFDTCALYKSVPEYSCVCNNLALSHEGANIIIRRLASIMPPTPHNTHSVTHSLYKSTILGIRVIKK